MHHSVGTRKKDLRFNKPKILGLRNLHRATVPRFSLLNFSFAILALLPVSSYRTSLPNWVVSSQLQLGISIAVWIAA